MAKENTWTFTQLAGPKNKLTLSGWSAPHGRAYKGSVAKDGINIRHRSTRYPGSSAPPTRHILGINYHDIDLKGRFRDRELGEGGAKAKVQEVKSFVKDLQTCDIVWGDILHVTGMIAEFIPGRESEREVEWTMKILVDQDNFEIQQVTSFQGVSITDLTAQIDAQAFLLVNIHANPFGGIRVNILDSLDDLVSSVTGAVGQLVNIANAIENFETGIANSAKRLIAGVHQARTALLHLMDAMSSAKQDELFIRDNAKDTINFNNSMHAAMTQADIALALLSDVENRATIQLTGDIKSTVRAKETDTWESLSTKYYGSPAEANTLRQANNAKFGKKPVAGQVISIPRL